MIGIPTSRGRTSGLFSQDSKVVGMRLAPSGSRYADHHRHIVRESLDALGGPTTGTVHVESRLIWSGRRGTRAPTELDAGTIFDDPRARQLSPGLAGSRERR